MSSPHAQTFGAYFLRGKYSKNRAIKHEVPLYDGDRLVIHDDEPESWITGDRITIIISGLCGCHASPYVVRAADKLQRRGIRTFRVDMRGFGDSALISRSHIHGGKYEDLMAVIDFVRRLSPLSKISLVGYSIGGNIVMKTLAVWGDERPDEVDSAVAVSPPIDLVHCAWNLRRRGNRVYEAYFMRELRSRLSRRRRMVKDLVDPGITPLPSRLIHFDDQFTAPCFGYRGAKEYYEDASSATQLNNVAVPTIILTAQDDPIVPFEMYSNYSMSKYIDIVAPQQGGHLGFLGQGRDPDRHWMDWRICQWVTSLDDDFAKEIKQPISSRRRRSRRESSIQA